MGRFYMHLAFVIALLLGITGCFKGDDNIHNGDKEYIILFPHIGQNLSRVSGNAFEAGDHIGVFVVPFDETNTTPGAINESDYAPNVEFRYNGSMWNTVSGEKIYWPPAAQNIDLYAYYPYNKDLNKSSALTYHFSVDLAQNTKAGYEYSDFLWATTPSVPLTRDPINLMFVHTMSKIRVHVKSDIEGINERLADATVTILNSKESTNINLADGSSSVDILSDPIKITTFKHSGSSGGYYLLTEAILIPQIMDNETPFIRIDIPDLGARYTYDLTTDMLFEAGKERTFNITITEFGLSVKVGPITDWEEADIIDGEIGKPIPKILNLDDINWNASLVQDIYDNGIRVGQVCREYLYKSGLIDAQAIVVYQVDGEGAIDYTYGFVTQIMNRARNETTHIYEPNTADVHGGGVFWGTGNLMASYMVGLQPLFSKVEISAGGVNPAASNAITTLNVVPDKLMDIDGNTYSIVKISSQFWMAENLKTEHYKDKTPLLYYYYADNISNKDLFGGLYDWNTAMDSHGIAPDGWSVPENNMFTLLYNYLGADAGKKIKANILWYYLIYNDNVTGFNGLPGGRRIATGAYDEMYYYSQWWSATATSVSDAYRLYLDFSNNAMHNTALGKNYTQSIRLIKD